MYYKQNNLFVEKVSARSISKRINTPFYCYSVDKLKNNINEFKKNFSSINPLICFSVKSNNNLNILKIINLSNCNILRHLQCVQSEYL